MDTKPSEATCEHLRHKQSNSAVYKVECADCGITMVAVWVPEPKEKIE